MIGTNLKPMPGLWMQPFQKVYTTHNGREVSGYIQSYQDDQLFISIPGASDEKEVILKKPDEVRLFDSSRRNQRVPNSSPVDYGKVSDDDAVSNGRTVSASIEVPKPSQRIRRTSEEPTMNELMAAMVLSSLSCSPVFHNQPKAESSPRSYDSSGVESWTHDSKHTSPSRHSSLVNTPAGGQASEGEMKDDGISSDFHRNSRTPEDALETDSGTILLQGSASTPTKPNPPSTEEMDDISDEPQDLSVPKVRLEEASAPRPRSRSSQIPTSYSEVGKLDVVMEHEEQQKTNPQLPISMAMPITIPQYPLSYYVPSAALYQSPFFGSLPAEFRLRLPGTPPVLSPEIGSSAPGVMDSKLHRYSHRAVPYQKFNDDSSVASPSGGSSPSTQQIYGSAPATYYHLPTSPIPVSSLSFSPSHHRKHTKSPLASKSQAPVLPSKITHSTPVSVPTSVPRGYPLLPLTNPASEHAMPKAFSWHNTAAPPAFLSKPAQQRPQLFPASSKSTVTASPKAVPMGNRKVRGDGKKCRKVYGMDHRDMWCTACRWKKACQRFPD